MSKTLVSLILCFSSVSAWAADELACPADSTTDALEEFRQSAIDQVLERNFGNVSQSLKRCFPGGPPRCMTSLKEYIDENQGSRAGYTYSESGSTGEAQDSANLTIKSEKDLPSEFQVKNAYGEVKTGVFAIPKDIEKIAKQKGWKVISYKTRGTGGFDDAPNLTLVAIPGKDRDIYIQISPFPDLNKHTTANEPNPHPSNGSTAIGQQTATVITMDKTKNPPVGQLRLLKDRNYVRGGGDNEYVWSNDLKHRSCIECHSHPLRTISPIGYLVTNGKEKRMSPEDEKTVRDINEMMTVNGASWGKSIINGRETRMGPRMDAQPYGWAPRNSKTRKEEFMRKCVEETSPVYYQGFGGYSFEAEPSSGHAQKVNWTKVATSMNCVQCHSNTVRGKLHEGFSFEEIQFKVLVDRSMPPGADLNQDERLALLSCLKQEFKEVRSKWKSEGEWLRGSFCDSFESSDSGSSSSNGVQGVK